MTDAPLANAPEARTPTGEILDVSLSPTPEPKIEPQPEPKPAPEPTSTTKLKEGETLLTEGDKPLEAAKAPEKYEDFKLPEGIELKGDQLAAAHTLFKEMGLPQDAAQKLVDFHTAQMKAAAEAPANALRDMRADWQAKTHADPDIAKVVDKDSGKVGLDAVKINIAKLYSAVGNEVMVNSFKEVMNLTGVGDHPAFINVLNKLAGFVTEGKHVAGGNPSVHGQNQGGVATPPTAAQALYPNLK